MPHIISTPRRRRIAAGSGTTLEEVNKLMASRKQMAKMLKAMGSGKMPSLPGTMPSASGGTGKPRPSATRKSSSKRKKKKAKR